jgi:hypothetical protein
MGKAPWLGMTWIPQKGPQLAALDADWCDELFYGGERGGGKSDFQLGYQEDAALRYEGKSAGIMFRKTYTELEELQMRAMQIFPASGAEYKSNPSKEFPFSSCWYWPNGATVKMRYIENEKDYGRYHGHQYSHQSFDEVTEYASPAGLLKMLSCLRNAHGVPCSVRCTGNPGGVGHSWVKSRYIDVAPPMTPFTDPDTGFVRMFVPSKLSDNQVLLSNDPKYANRILAATAGNEVLRKAWLEGAWDIVAGAFFSSWDGKAHVVQPCELPAHWTRFRSFDWGSAKPFSVGWWAVSDGELHQFPRGAIIRYREWYGMETPNVGLKMSAEAVAAGIKRREENDRIAYGVADPAIFAEDGGPSIAQSMSPTVYWRPADNKRQPGWAQLNSRLIGIDGKPMIYFFNTCIDAIRTLPVQQHDKHKIEDIDTNGEDHCADEVRYACMSRPWVAPKSDAEKKARNDYAAHDEDDDEDGWKTA